ncbi:hypothetical protein WICMUC_004416 [Wickerhamomyces mucosus]|uniref:Uncharacterized protein n=1 Tax=Wickerhamomyces mucosus TaxID=1378264 RepID=A0A9P8PI06_9ASCO|nr:hypothetical protein WICMUC_004416 [Wickerhamomyces mucosus]
MAEIIIDPSDSEGFVPQEIPLENDENINNLQFGTDQDDDSDYYDEDYDYTYDDYDSSDDETELRNAQLQWEESLSQLKTLVGFVILPLIGKVLGRRFAGYGKFHILLLICPHLLTIYC